MSGRVYGRGNVLTFSAFFTDELGNPVTPDIVTFVAEVGTRRNEYTGTDLSNPTTGQFVIELPLDISGQWSFAWFSVGAGAATHEGRFVVRESTVLP